MKPLLLHICCAPCGGGCIAHPLLSANDYEVSLLYFSNSNLDSVREYEKRLKWVQELGMLAGVKVESDPYDHASWLEAVAGFESEKEGGARCRHCFRYNLARAAAKAAEYGYDFATTLTVSPRKSSPVIFAEGEHWDNFSPLNFKKADGYLTGTRFAREHGFYRQNYCGCEFSRRDSEQIREMTPPPESNPFSS